VYPNEVEFSHNRSCSEDHGEGEEAQGNRRESYAPGRVVEEEACDGDKGEAHSNA